ncbi:MAG: nucleotidyltransferase substrate binding protein [Ignavibacteria bacterium]|nr:nucleotidyltransferase substrate binding protein [Ignavibacteria bacterium]
MENNDSRWEQRFKNYRKALSKLSEIAEGNDRQFILKISELETEGIIQRFEYTFELAWKTLQDLLRSKGFVEISGPNPVIEQSFADGYISDGEKWKEMKKSRELTSHTYDIEIANTIAVDIIEKYYELFKILEKRLEKEIKI